MHSKTALFNTGVLALIFVNANCVNSQGTTTTISVSAPAPTVTSAAQCKTGTIACCNSLTHASNENVELILGLLGVQLPDLSILVGVGCTSISAADVGSATCTQQAVCCTDNQFNGIIDIGCVPITL